MKGSWLTKSLLTAPLVALAAVGVATLLPLRRGGSGEGGGVVHAHTGPTLEQVRGLAALTVLSVDVADVQVSDLHGFTGGIKAALVVKGELALSTDLSAARFESVDVQNRTAVLVLPPPHVSSPRLDHSRTRLVWVWEYGLWQAVPGDRPHAAVVNRAYQEAQAVIAAAGQDPSLDPRARAQAESVLGTFFNALGWQVSVRWSEPPKQ